MYITIGKPYAVSEKGRRSNNEDAVYPLPERVHADQKLFLVCDGVGGAEKGEVASALACESIHTFWRATRLPILYNGPFSIRRLVSMPISTSIRKRWGWRQP